MPIRTHVTSFIRTIPDGEPIALFEGTPEDVLASVRNQCNEKGTSIEEWALLIRNHAQLPHDHPYQALCNRLKLADNHPLRTLGSWAFGFDNSWIIIDWIKTESGQLISRQEFDPNYRP